MIKIEILRIILPIVLCLPMGTISYGAEDNSKSSVILTKEDILKINPTCIQDVLNSVPGVNAGESSVMLRGSTAVKVLLNGRPLNDPTSSVGGVKLDQVVVADIDRIEIIKGGGGVSYGDNASGGVVLITSDSKKGLTGFIETGGGDYGTYNTKGSTTSVLGGLTLNAAGSWFTTDGFIRNDDEKKYSVGMKADYKFSDKTSLGLAFDYFGQEGGLPGDLIYPTPYSRKDYDLFIGGINLSLPLFKVNSFLNKGINNNSDISRDKDTTLEVLKTGHKISTALPLHKLLNISAGGGFEYKEGLGKGHYGTVDYSFEKKTEKSFYGYISNSMEIKELFLSINAGGRYIYYTEYDNAISPEVTVNFKPGSFGIKGSFSMTYNTPTFLQRYQATSSKDPNPDIDMEKAKNYSVSFFLSPDKSFLLTAGGFYNIIEDRITYVYDYDGSGMNRYENFGEVIYKGADSSLKIEPFSFICLKGTYLYLITEDTETGLWMSCRARHNFKGQIEIKPVRNLCLLFEADYKSKLYTNSSNTREADARILYDMTLRYKAGRFTFKLEVENIADTEYLIETGGEGYPRRWNGSVKFNF